MAKTILQRAGCSAYFSKQERVFWGQPYTMTRCLTDSKNRWGESCALRRYSEAVSHGGKSLCQQHSRSSQEDCKQGIQENLQQLTASSSAFLHNSQQIFLLHAWKNFSNNTKWMQNSSQAFNTFQASGKKKITSPFSGMERNILTVKTHTDGVCSNRESTCPGCISALSEEWSRSLHCLDTSTKRSRLLHSHWVHSSDSFPLCFVGQGWK